MVQQLIGHLHLCQQTSQGTLELFRNQDWAQLAKLFHRPWFKRLWVIQEVCSSENVTVYWGSLSVPWSELQSAAAVILKPGDFPDIIFPSSIKKILPLMGAHHLTQVDLPSLRHFDKNNILTALWHTRKACCSDPRDRLYALLGLVYDTSDIKIDYGSSVETVYRNWAVDRIL